VRLIVHLRQVPVRSVRLAPPRGLRLGRDGSCSHAPDDSLPRFFAALQHVDDGLATLAQTDGLELGRRMARVLGLCHRLSLLRLLGLHCFLQGQYGLRHVLGLDDALGLYGFADQLQKLFALRFQQYQVAGGFGFEFIEHVSIVRLSQWQAFQQRLIERLGLFKLYPVACALNDMELLEITPLQQIG